MGAFLAANFARVNQIYQQSGVDVEFDVVHHEQVDFSAIDPVNWKATLSLALMQSELGLAAHAVRRRNFPDSRCLFLRDSF
jgi:hypothetical protein